MVTIKSLGYDVTQQSSEQYLMRVRYSEFEMRFQMPGEKFIHTLPNFKQVSPGNWLPGAQSEWDKKGVHYTVTYINTPGVPQSLDYC
jgi:hypothetical protein